MPRVADPDRGTARALTNKATKVLDSEEFTERGRVRDGARELDLMGEATPGLTRQQRDRHRAMPRGTTAEPRPRTVRGLPDAGDTRVPLSARQRRERSKTKQEVRRRLRATERRALRQAIQDRAHWTWMNDALSEAIGDVQQLPDDQRVEVQRLDRAIQGYERHNDRGHVVYANVELPRAVNSGNIDGFIGNQFEPGRVLDFDRFTGTSHSLHEIEPTNWRGYEPAFEIKTRRGFYLGRSTSLDDTRHLLPRGLRLRVLGHHYTEFTRPDGSTGRRLIIQLEDLTEE